MYYKTFIRSFKIDPRFPGIQNNFLSGRKMTDMGNLTLEEARARCEKYNARRNARQIRNGTMMEFESE